MSSGKPNSEVITVYLPTHPPIFQNPHICYVCDDLLEKNTQQTNTLVSWIAEFVSFEKTRTADIYIIPVVQFGIKTAKAIYNYEIIWNNQCVSYCIVQFYVEEDTWFWLR